MTTDDRGPGGGGTSVLTAWRPVLQILAIVLTVGAVFRVPQETYRLAFEPLGSGASTDLKKRHIEFAAWFKGVPVYGAIESADYPPASYPVFWPFIGWGMNLDSARVVWALTSLAALGWLVWVVLRGSGGGTRLEQWFLASAVVAAYATSANIRIGQAGIHLMAPIVAATLLVGRPGPGHFNAILIAFLMLVALVKPTFTAPFVWLVVFRGGLLPTVALVGGYVVLTLLGASFQHESLANLVRGWLDQGSLVEFHTAHANVHSWLGQLGYSQWILPASLIALAASGVWTLVYRHASPWLILGVLAIVARMWSYHRWYDDILLVPALIALYRVAREEPPRSYVGHAAALLLIGIVVLGAAPASWLSYGPPWGDAFKAIKTATWLMGLAFLLWRAATSSAPAREPVSMRTPRLSVGAP
jgi:hypothetical protein